MVVVGGGDGTVSEVAKSTRRFRSVLYLLAPIIISPAALTCRPIGELLVLAHGQVKSIDVGQANDEHYFFEAAGVE